MQYIVFTIILFFVVSCQNNEPQTKIEKVQGIITDSTGLSCCSDNIPKRFLSTQKSDSVNQSKDLSMTGMIWIPSGSFTMGGDDQWSRSDEQPLHQVSLEGYYIDEAPVTNAQFSQFVKETNYKTTAEQKPDWEIIKTQVPPNTPKPHDSILQPASLVFTPPNHPVGLDNHLVWWAWVEGANWQHPNGPNSTLNGLDNHPVIHVSWEDAYAFAQWAGKRLPTEAEFEYASRGGRDRNLYPWGNERIHQGAVKANSWEGSFPLDNTYVDGYYTTSPVKTYPPNPYGLYDIAGNVWEWCADWYHYQYYENVKEGVSNPMGPDQSLDPAEPRVPKKVVRGGSYLCNDSYCSGFRSAARMKNDPYTSQSHLGFRCAKSK